MNKSDLGLSKPGQTRDGSYFAGMGSATKANFSKTKYDRERDYRSNRFGSTVKEWNVCLKMVFLRENGHTYGSIAKYLNGANITTKAGKPWNYYTARFVTLRAKEEIENGRND
jgi:hypothetical protein